MSNFIGISRLTRHSPEIFCVSTIGTCSDKTRRSRGVRKMRTCVHNSQLSRPIMKFFVIGIRCKNCFVIQISNIFCRFDQTKRDCEEQHRKIEELQRQNVDLQTQIGLLQMQGDDKNERNRELKAENDSLNEALKKLRIVSYVTPFLRSFWAIHLKTTVDLNHSTTFCYHLTIVVIPYKYFKKRLGKKLGLLHTIAR